MSVEENKAAKPAITIDSQGFVFADGVRFGRLSATGQSIQILDKDKRRCQERGSRFVEIPIAALTKLAAKE